MNYINKYHKNNNYTVNEQTFKDKRLPEGYTVHRNKFDEYVVCNESGVVAKIDDKNTNVRASYTLEVAIEHYLNKRPSNGRCE